MCLVREKMKEYAKNDPTTTAEFERKFEQKTDRTDILHKMYKSGEIHLIPHTKVMSVSPDQNVAKIYRWFSIVVFLANQKEMDVEMERIRGNITDEETSKDDSYVRNLAFNEGTVDPIFVVCAIKMMRCKHCKNYYKYNITSGRSHIARHLNWFRKYGSQEEKDILVSIGDGCIATMDELEDAGLKEEKLLILAEQSQSYFNRFDEDPRMEQIYNKFNQLPLTIPESDTNILNCSHDLIIRLSTVLGLTPSRIQNWALRYIATVKCLCL